MGRKKSDGDISINETNLSMEDMFDEDDIEVTEYDELEFDSYERDNNLADSLQQTLKNYCQYPLLKVEEERRLLLEYHETKSPQARERLIFSNLRLVIQQAMKAKLYFGRQIDPNDLIEDGIIGLITAIDRFDPDKGNRLSTYAVRWITQNITKGSKDYLAGNAMTIPNTAAYDLRRLKKFMQKYEDENHISPTIEQIAKGIGVSRKHVCDLIRIGDGISSIDYKINDNDNGNDKELNNVISSLYENDSMDPTADAVAEIEVMNAIKGIEKYLSARTYNILCKSAGINGERQHSIDEIAKQEHVTAERIRQIIKAAYKQLAENEEFSGIVGVYVKEN